jgi:tetratricopeptide (TPR) repeat protein
MKYFAFVLLSLISVTAWSQGRVDATNLQLAGKYYQEKNYEKAAPLYEQIYQASQSTVYFNMYLDCLVGLGDYETAEKAIRQEIRKRPDKSAFYVQWGYILKSRNNYQEAEKKFDQALEAIGDNPNDYRIWPTPSSRDANLAMPKKCICWPATGRTVPIFTTSWPMYIITSGIMKKCSRNILTG